MDRKTAPIIRDVKSIEILPPQQYPLKNNGKLFHLSEVDDDAVKIDLIFDAGSSKHDKLVSKVTGDLLLSGTSEKTSDAINGSIDQLGGFTNVEVGPEETTVSVLGLSEHILDILNIVVDAILHVTFDEREVKQTLASRKHKFNVNMEKVGTLARRAFIANVFPDTSYGQLTELKDFDRLERNDLIQFHKNFYLDSLQNIAIVGNVTQETVNKIISVTRSFGYNDQKKSNYDYKYTPQVIDKEKKGAVQTAIRIGRILFNKKHSDFIDFSVLNTILGGYFGSRLMTSIREDKGYTYGIGSGVAQLTDTGYFFISTEVGEQYKEATINAIKHEIQLLQDELVSPDELELVRNYITGQILKNADGPFAQMDRFLSVEKHGMDLSYYNDILSELNNITPERIRNLANQYLSWDDLIIVKAG